MNRELNRELTDLERVVSRNRQLRPRTKELYLRCIRSFLTFAGTDAKAWTAPAVKKWRDDMRTRGVKPQSINVALNALRFAARRRAQRVAGAKPFADHTDTLPAGNAKEGRAITYVEGKRLLAACQGRKPRDLRDAAIIVLGLRTGMLRFSMCQIEATDLAGDQMTFVKKGGVRHALTMDAAIQDALAPWLEWLKRRGHQSGPIFRSLGRERLNGSVDIGERLTPDGLYRALQARAKRADIGDLNPHIFRKTFLAWVKKEGAQPHQIAMVTGHKSDGTVPMGGSKDLPANMLIPDFIAAPSREPKT